MFLYFIRHGESEANLLHEFSNLGWRHGLTELGRQQAHHLAENLRETKVRKIYTSPLMRAVQTAQILSARLHVKFEVTDSLREFDTGINEGCIDCESWQRWQTVMDNWIRLRLYESRIPQGESFNDMRRRFYPLIERVCTEYTDPSDSLLMIGHGGLFWCMLPVLLNLETGEIGSLPFPNTAYVLAESTSKGLVCREWCGKSMDGRNAIL